MHLYENSSGGFGQEQGEMPTAPPEDIARESIVAEAGFGAAFSRYFDPVHRYIRRRLGVDLADELAAETFARAYQARGSYLPEQGSVEAWLLGIATNLIRRQRRAEGRRLRAYARSPRPDVADDPAGGADARLAAAEARPAIGRALRAMRARDRDVLLLTAWGELSYAEVAAALDIPIGTVRSRLSRARGVLRAELAASGNFPNQPPEDPPPALPTKGAPQHGRD